MILHKKIPLEFEDRHYEIRVYNDDVTINVVAFQNNRPANGFRHTAKMPKRVDIGRLLEKHPPVELIEICKNDLTEKRWEPLAKAIAEAGADPKA